MGLIVTSVSMQAPPAPTCAVWLPTLRMEMLFGATTSIVSVAEAVPTFSVTVTLAAVAGAVQRKVVDAAPVAVPAEAVHVPAALPVKTTSSPTPTLLRVFAAPDGAALTVALVIVGPAGAAGGGMPGAGAGVGVGAGEGDGPVWIGADGALSATSAWPTGPSSSSASRAVEPAGGAVSATFAKDHSAGGAESRASSRSSEETARAADGIRAAAGRCARANVAN